MANKPSVCLVYTEMNKCSTWLIFREHKSKLQWGITSHQSEWPSPKNLRIINAGEDMEKREPSYTVGGNVTLIQPLWRTAWRFLKNKQTNKQTGINLLLSSNPTTGHIPWENHNSKDTCTPMFTAALFTQ